ncbi:hypothetical protein B4U79_03894 [Dinothrombium tinctorium]|uniref:Polyprenal reductase n=1 Tax=Dinothrombium tinctorium TaxID=1965070 RepID=A0A3S4RI15_9ACAR|nr:hypothetical protein B4U79_10081 [Dinothrombium tinctorium]RWS16450.1 hypothetical protein B4U79_03894 [Dinothrombium tinctorium]
MIYFSFYLMSNCDSSWHGLLSWVIVSQTLSSILAHRWYVNKFGDRYPKRRKAIIPFIF